MKRQYLSPYFKGNEIKHNDKNSININIESSEIVVGNKPIAIHDINNNETVTEWFGTQEQYDIITLKEPNMRYNITATDGTIKQLFFKGQHPTQYFDPRISLVITGGRDGLRYWNSDNDPMPLKIAGGKSIRECIVEETDDYIIYSDGQQVTVQNYVSGTYDLYLKRLETDSITKPTRNYNGDVIDGLPMLNVEIEPIIDHAKLLNDINDEQLKKLAEQPQILPVMESDVADDETQFKMPTLSSRIIPIPIDFCCRVDKKTGEIYIGEGYENLFGIANWNSNSFIETLQNDIYKLYFKDDFTQHNFLGLTQPVHTLANNPIFFGASIIKNSRGTRLQMNGFPEFSGTEISWVNTYTSDWTYILSYGIYNITNVFKKGEELVLKNPIITKTDHAVPYVKTQMPSGKMSILSNADEKTHSYIMKGASCPTNHINNIPFRFVNQDSSDNHFPWYADWSTSSNHIGDIMFSSRYNKAIMEDGTIYNGGIDNRNHDRKIGQLTVRYNFRYSPKMFKQLLIYKGNLTETELKAENNKPLNLWSKYNQAL